VELRRRTGNEGDRLTQGAADAEMIGRDGLHPPCAAFVSAGAARAIQMPEMLRHAAGQDDTPITAAAGAAVLGGESLARQVTPDGRNGA
jgi:hypothetical protein